VGLFSRRRKPLEPLVIDPFAARSATSAQDNLPGPSAPDLESLENHDAIREAQRGSFGRGNVGVGPAVLRNTKLDPYSVEPRLIPDNEPKDD
jgi:hypothetical protein